MRLWHKHDSVKIPLSLGQSCTHHAHKHSALPTTHTYIGTYRPEIKTVIRLSKPTAVPCVAYCNCLTWSRSRRQRYSRVECHPQACCDCSRRVVLVGKRLGCGRGHTASRPNRHYLAFTWYVHSVYKSVCIQASRDVNTRASRYSRHDTNLLFLMSLTADVDLSRGPYVDDSSWLL